MPPDCLTGWAITLVCTLLVAAGMVAALVFTLGTPESFVTELSVAGAVIGGLLYAMWGGFLLARWLLVVALVAFGWLAFDVALATRSRPAIGIGVGQVMTALALSVFPQVESFLRYRAGRAR